MWCRTMVDVTDMLLRIFPCVCREEQRPNHGSFRPSFGRRRSSEGPKSDQMSSLQRYRSQTIKDYGLMIEYKHLRQHVPAGIYVLPSFDDSRVWYGTIFIHTGLYRNGVFKFTIYIPEEYNAAGTFPKIVFNTTVFHPYVHPETRQLDLTPKFPEWDPELHYMVAVLTYLKSIFYMKEFPEDAQVANPTAVHLFHNSPEDFVQKVESSVEESLGTVYHNEKDTPLRFTRHNPAHESLRKELLSQLDQDTSDEDGSNHEKKRAFGPELPPEMHPQASQDSNLEEKAQEAAAYVREMSKAAE